MEKAIVKDLVGEKVDRLYTGSGADILSLETCGEEALEVVDKSAGRASRARRRMVVKEARPFASGGRQRQANPKALSISCVRPRALLARRLRIPGP